MKKLLSIILVACLVFTFAACAAKTETPAAPAEDTEPPATEAPEAVPEEATEPAAEKGHWIVGYNNYDMAGDFAQKLYAGLEDKCAEAGIEIMYAEASGDPQKMISNIDSFITAGVDAIIDFNFNPEVGVTLVQMCSDAGIPLFSIDCAYSGAYFFGVNNMVAGQTAGEYAGKITNESWGGELDWLVIEYNAAAGPEVKQRTDGIPDGMKNVGVEVSADRIYEIDFNNDITRAQSTAADFLSAHPDDHRILFAASTDEAAAGILAAVETAGRSDDVMIISHGGSDIAVDMLKRDNCFMSTVCYDSGRYADTLVPALVSVLSGEECPTESYAVQYLLTRENVE